MSKILALILLLLASPAFADNPPAGDGWSDAVNGLQARLVLKPWSRCNGTLIVAPYLDLQNEASTVHFPWKSAKMTFHVVDADGHNFKSPSMAYDGFERPKADPVIPLEGELLFDIAGAGAGIPADIGALIDLGDPDTTWEIPADGKVYYLKAVLEIAGKEEKNADGTRNWAGKISLPPVPIPETAPQPDPAAAGAIIDELGRQMLANRGPVAGESRRELSTIDDPRVIDWYVKAMKTDDYSLKFDAIDRLCRFPGDAALDGLKIGMHTRGSDIGHCATAQVAAESADGIRGETADALARSPNPAASKLLLSMAEDPYYGVRLEVVHAAAISKTPDSIAVIRRLVNDADKSVRDEATRELKSLARGKNAG